MSFFQSPVDSSNRRRNGILFFYFFFMTIYLYNRCNQAAKMLLSIINGTIFSWKISPWFVSSQQVFRYFYFVFFCFCFRSHSELLLTPRRNLSAHLSVRARFPRPNNRCVPAHWCHNIGRKSWNDLGDSRLERALDKCAVECEAEKAMATTLAEWEHLSRARTKREFSLIPDIVYIGERENRWKIMNERVVFGTRHTTATSTTAWSDESKEAQKRIFKVAEEVALISH